MVYSTLLVMNVSLLLSTLVPVTDLAAVTVEGADVVAVIVETGVVVPGVNSK